MPETTPAPDALAAMREALEKRDGESFQDHDTRVGAECGYHLPALLDELAGLRGADERRERDRQQRLRAPLDEVTPLKGGYTLYRSPDEVGGRDYYSDEVGGGVHVWNTSLVSPETMRAALEAEGANGWHPIDPENPETWPDTEAAECPE